MIAASITFALPARAQFWDSPWQRSRDSYSYPFFGGERGSFFRPFGTPYRSAPVDYSRAPPPKKAETTPTSTILVIGDSMADWLGYGLEETFADTPEIGVVRKVRASSGLVRYEGRSDTPEWSEAVKELWATERPSVIVVMLGLNDRQSLRERLAPHSPQQRNGQPGEAGHGRAARSGSETAESQRPAQVETAEFHTDQWADLYGKRIDAMIAALRMKAPVVWVGLPAIRGTRGTRDMSYLDDLYRAHAEKAGITYVDVWDAFVDDSGRFTMQGPDFEGQIRRLRSGDGVHFTKAGAVKLAHYAEHDLRRILSSAHPMAVALPGPEGKQSKAGTIGTGPTVGPVVPLSDTGEADTGDLVGAGIGAGVVKTNPVAAAVLSRGDPMAAPSGRADDFSWPRAGTTPHPGE